MNRMQEITITREELYAKVWSAPLTQLAKAFKISDVGLRKKCLKRNIPVPPLGHWAKVKFGKKTRRKPLPKDENQEPIKLHIRDDNELSNDPVQIERMRIKHEISTKYPQYLKPTRTLKKPHPLVSEFKNQISKEKESYDGYLRGSKWASLNITVSKALMPLSLKVFNTFIKLADKRGFVIKIINGSTAACKDDIEVQIDMREKQKRVMTTSTYGGDEYQTTAPCGVLCFRMGSYNKREWTNAKKSIEEQFPSIFAKLEMLVSEEKRWKIQSEKDRIKRELEKKLQKEKYEIQVAEFEKLQLLIDDASRWQKAQMMRSYINHLEKITSDKKWIDWARKKADWVDPTSQSEDDILGTYGTEAPKKPGYW